MSAATNKPKPDNVAWAIFFIVGLLLSLAPMMQPVYALETVIVTRSPSSFEHQPQGGWTSPTNVYTSNDLRATESDLDDQTNWYGYHFQDYLNDSLLDFNITKVEYGWEGYKTSNDVDQIFSIDNGTTE